jgi:hypothetical protein
MVPGSRSPGQPEMPVTDPQIEARNMQTLTETTR